MVTNQKRPTVTQRLWSERIVAWQKSGLSQVAYCQQHQLTYGTFIYWRSYLKKHSSGHKVSVPSTFIPITIKADKATPLVLQIAEQYRIELRPGFDPHLLTQIIQVIQHTHDPR